MKIFIIAGSKVEFIAFISIETMGFKKQDVIYLHDVHQVRGCRDIKVIILAGAYTVAEKNKLIVEVNQIIKHNEGRT